MHLRDVRKDYASFLRAVLSTRAKGTTLLMELPSQVYQDAILVSASYVHNMTHDAKSTQEFMNAFSHTGGWRLHPNAIDRESVVAMNTSLKEVVVAFRGSSQTVDDWQCVKSIADGSYIQHPQFQNAFTRVRGIQHSLPKGYTLRLLGYSMGGAKAVIVGEVLNIPSITFNPFLPLRNMHHVTGTATQQVFRVVNDPTTFHSIMPYHNRVFTHVMPMKDDASLFERIIKPHSLKQFMQVAKSRPHMSMDELHQHYHSHHEFNQRMENLADIQHLTNARMAVIRGEGFSQYVVSYHPETASYAQTLQLHPRLGAKAVHAYTAVGGSLTAEEKAAVSAFPKPKWKVAPKTVANETTLRNIASIRDFYKSQVIHYEQRLLSTRTHMGNLMREHGSFMGFALLGAFLGYSEGHSKAERFYRSTVGGIESTLPYLSLTDFLDTIGVPFLPEEKREIHKALFGNSERLHYKDFTKHDPVSNMLLDILPWGMARRKQDYELTMQELNHEDEALAAQHKTVIDIGKYTARSSNSPTIINRRTGAKFHLVSSP